LSRGVQRYSTAFSSQNLRVDRSIWPIVVAAFMLVVGASGGLVGGQAAVDARFDPAVFPVDAVAFAKANHLTGRVFNEFEWGGYMLYAWPEEKVFIDGQTDFYGEALTREYVKVIDVKPGWRDVLKEWDVSLVLVPSNSAVAAELQRESGWSV